MKGLRITLWIAAFVLAGVLVWLTLTVTRQQPMVAEGPFGVPFRLTAQDGQAITEQAFRDKPTAVFFGFTHCPDVCPTTLQQISDVLGALGPKAEALKVAFVSVDPERDTPDVLNQYISNVSDRIKGISGAPADVQAMVKGFNVYARKVPVDDANPHGDYTMDHTASVFLLNEGGRFAGTISYGEDPETAQKKLANLIKG
jgi:protein SCO1/2